MWRTIHQTLCFLHNAPVPFCLKNVTRVVTVGAFGAQLVTRKSDGSQMIVVFLRDGKDATHEAGAFAHSRISEISSIFFGAPDFATLIIARPISSVVKMEYGNRRRRSGNNGFTRVYATRYDAVFDRSPCAASIAPGR